LNLTVKLLPEDKEILVDLASRTGMNQNVIVGYLLEQAIKYEMFDADWIDKLTKVAFHDLLLEADLDYRKGFEIAKYKATLGLRSSLVKELIKAMPAEERVTYLKETLGNPQKGVNLLDDMASHQIFTVNGEKKMIAPGQDGRPQITGIPPSQILQCPRGWHIEHNPCIGCNVNRTCPIVFNERTDWLALHGTHEEREEHIIKSGRRLPG